MYIVWIKSQMERRSVSTKWTKATKRFPNQYPDTATYLYLCVCVWVTALDAIVLVYDNTHNAHRCCWWWRRPRQTHQKKILLNNNTERSITRKTLFFFTPLTTIPKHSLIFVDFVALITFQFNFSSSPRTIAISYLFSTLFWFWVTLILFFFVNFFTHFSTLLLTCLRSVVCFGFCFTDYA